MVTYARYTDIGNVPGAWRDSTIASNASAAIRQYGSYNPGTDVRLSNGSLVRTSDPAARSAIEARSSSLGNALSSYNSGRSAFDSGPRTSAGERNQLVGEAANLRQQVTSYNHDAPLFNNASR